LIKLSTKSTGCISGDRPKEILLVLLVVAIRTYILAVISVCNRDASFLLTGIL